MKVLLFVFIAALAALIFYWASTAQTPKQPEPQRQQVGLQDTKDAVHGAIRSGRNVGENTGKALEGVKFPAQ